MCIAGIRLMSSKKTYWKQSRKSAKYEDTWENQVTRTRCFSTKLGSANLWSRSRRTKSSSTAFTREWASNHCLQFTQFLSNCKHSLKTNKRNKEYSRFESKTSKKAVVKQARTAWVKKAATPNPKTPTPALTRTAAPASNPRWRPTTATWTN